MLSHSILMTTKKGTSIYLICCKTSKNLRYVYALSNDPLQIYNVGLNAKLTKYI